MASLFDEDSDVPGAGAALDRRKREAGDLPVEHVAQGTASQPTLGVDGEAGLEAPARVRKIVHPEYEPKEVGENPVLGGNPPAPALSGREGGISEAQRKIADYKITHPDANDSEIARGVGSMPATVARALGRPQVRMYMSQFLDEAGATLQKAARVISEAQDASKITYFADKGVVTDERVDVDHQTRLRGAEISAELHGAGEDKGMQVNVFQGLTDAQLAEVRAGRARPQDFIEGEVS